MTKIFNWFDNWKTESLACLKCGWHGTIDTDSTGEYDQLLDFHCPKCNVMLAIINFPTLDEIREHPDKLSAAEKGFYAQRMELDAEFEKTNLESPDQLPAISADPLVLVLDIEFDSRGETAGPTYTTIKHAGQVIWREPAYYECVARFNEMVKILRQKYGDRLKALIPTSASHTYLYGDRISHQKLDINTHAADSVLTTEALAQAGDQDAINHLRYQREFEAHHLQQADQLPEISGDFLILSWDLAERPPRVNVQIRQDSFQYEWDKHRGDGFLYVTLRHEGRELWSEAADLESTRSEDGELRRKIAERYGDLAKIVKSKYGARLKDLVPSLPSAAYYGGGLVDKALEKVRGIYFPKTEDAMLNLWRKAVAGYPEEQTRVGDFLRQGSGVPKDWTRAAYWYRQAADQGDPYGQGSVGLMYEFGDGVPQDDAEAITWYRKAAAQGDSYAQYSLGIRYRNGRGVPQDHAQAVEWFRKAADQGQENAQCNLASMYESGQGLSQDYVQAHMWFDVAAARYPDSQTEERVEALKNRDAVAAKMTPPQITEAQRLAQAWTSNWDAQQLQLTADEDGSQKEEPRISVPVLPLQDICPTWKGSLIPSEFAALLRGIEREKARLNGSRFLTLRFQHEIDKGLVSRSLAILNGFPDQVAAIHSTDQEAAEALAAAFVEPWCLDDSKWMQMLMSDRFHVKPNPDDSHVTSIYDKVFCLHNSPLGIRYFRFEVFHVTSKEIIGPDFFSAIGAESEWVQYLIAQGERSSPSDTVGA